MPSATDANIDLHLAGLNMACERFGIDTPERIALFLAQLAHESGSLRYVTELASGEAYEGRKDLGNTQPGDGKRFKGRGLIQITGRTNYTNVGKDFGVNFTAVPETLATAPYAAQTAGWFWSRAGLNKYADGLDLKAVTRRINGGYNGYADRLAHWIRIRKVFGLPDFSPDQVARYSKI